jgi:hypothetical protein
MSIYLYKNDQQLGPYEDSYVVDQLRRGSLSPDDLAIRQGGKDWLRLGDLFPSVAPDAFSRPDEPVVGVPLASEPVYRRTGIQKAFFGLCLLIAVIALAGSVYYFYSLMGSSGNLETDLGRMSYRLLARNAAAGIFVGGFFAFLAFLLTFKRKLIASNGLRVVLRIVFILIMLVGIGNMIASAVSFLAYTAPYKSPSTSGSNELLRALEQGSEAVAPYELPVILLPVGAGLLLLGLSGVLMTTKHRPGN